MTALAIVTGYGMENVGAEWSSKVSGVLVDLSDRYLFAGYGDFLLAMVALSGFSVAIANANSTVRIVYSWAQRGYLPQALARSHRKYQTPHYAAAALAAVTAVCLLVFYLWQGGSPAGGVQLIHVALARRSLRRDPDLSDGRRSGLRVRATPPQGPTVHLCGARTVHLSNGIGTHHLLRANATCSSLHMDPVRGSWSGDGWWNYAARAATKKPLPIESGARIP